MRWTLLCLVTGYLASYAAGQQTLSVIRHATNLGATVDINLSNTGTTGTCRLRQPNGQEVDLATINLVGVTVQPNSKFVSCRVTIGPMTEALLGDWALIENSGTTSRTQPVNIAWADTSNPSATARQRVLNGAQHYKVNLGSLVVANLRRETGIFEGCFITAPDGTTMPLSETTNYPGIEWTSRPNSVNICHAQLGPIDAEMVGRWTMLAWFIHDGLRIEAQQPIHVHEEDGIEHLPPLEYLTHTGKSYDVSLNRTELVNVASCVLIHPDGTEYTLTTTTDIPGVTVANADNYVICRVRIGPMDPTLIGEWTLVQRNTDTTERRQHVIFQWANPSNPDEDSWFVAHDIPRHIWALAGSTREIFIGRNEGFFEFCYITTPEGVHLPMYGRNYPGIKHVLSNRVSSCVVELGPLNAAMWGDWVLHARHEVNGRLIELAQVFHVALDTGVRTQPRLRHWTQLGATIDINLNHTGVTSTCRLQAPSGIEYTITPGQTPLAGVTVHGSSRYVSCRVTIGPMTANLVGEWVLVEQSSGSQRRQPVIIQFAHPAHPEREARELIIPPEFVVATDLDGFVEAGVARSMGTFEGCYLTVPDGTVLPMMYNTQYPGIRLLQPTRIVSCLLEIGPVTADMAGRYTLSGMGHHVGVRTETQQSFTIIEDDGITNDPPLFIQTHTGALEDINLSQNGSIGTCMLRNPGGQIFLLDSSFNQPGVTVHSSSKFVACRVTIGPMSEELLGDWTLMHQVTGQRERRVHAAVFWANPMDPSSSYRIITAQEQNIVGAFGDTVSVTVPLYPGFALGCLVIAPDGTVMPHSGNHDYPGVGWARPNSIAACTALLGPLDDSMMGRWTVAGRFDEGGQLVESQQSITLGRNTANEMELPVLEYLTNVGALVDLSLDNIGKPVQSCALLTSSGEYHELTENSNIAGVRVHGPSKFVSCRVTIGPMTEELLGTWALLEHDADGTHRRQPAVFAWANPSNPNAEPRLMIAAQQELRADSGEILNLFISRESGFFEGCYITTPDGSVLPLFPHMHYPGITHAGLNRLTACFVDLGPMDGQMVGQWIIAARFNNAGSRVETQLPINLVLGDGMHRLPPIHELTYLNGYVDLNLNQTGVAGGCSLTTPDGEEHVLGTISGIPGVAIHTASKFVACRVVIGPMTETLLGNWVITHMGADNTERHQPMTIAWENPTNPSAQRTVTTETLQSYNVRPGTIISTSIRREDGLFEGCFLTTPDGTILPVMENNAYPGTIWAGANRITACFVQIGPVDPEEEGTWTLVAKTNNYGARTELRIPIQVSLMQEQPLLVDNYPRREIFTSLGTFVDIALNETGNIAGGCSLRNPAGQTYLLQNTVMLSGVEVRSNNQHVSCNVRIGPMSHQLLGLWTLIQQDTLTTERTQPVQISWAHPANPQEPPRLIRRAVEEVVVEENTVFTLAAPRDFNDSFSEGCFIATPDSTILPISGDNRYPGIVNAGANRHTVCFVDIGPINTEMAGPWMLFSIVNRAGERIISENPAHITISDGVVRLPALQHVAFEGHFIDLALNQTGQTGNCLLRTPGGHEYTLHTAEGLDGITVHEQSKFVSCRVVLGPITESMIGNWTLIQQFTDPHLREQRAAIAWANPDNTAAEVWDIRTQPDREIYGDYGASVEISIARDNLNHLFEGCFITTPDGATLPIFSTNAYPGISHLGVNQVTACFVELGPIDSDMAGTWILAGRFNDNGVRHEDRQTFFLTIGSPPPAPPTSSFNATALIVSLTVIFAVVFVVVGVLAFRRSREWSFQRFHNLRSSMRSVASRTPIVHDHELESRT